MNIEFSDLKRLLEAVASAEIGEEIVFQKEIQTSFGGARKGKSSGYYVKERLIYRS